MIVCLEVLIWLFSPVCDAVKLNLEFGFIRPFVVINPTDSGTTAVVAPGRIIDIFLPIPDAESLPLYRMLLNLACDYTLFETSDKRNRASFQIANGGKKASLVTLVRRNCEDRTHAARTGGAGLIIFAHNEYNLDKYKNKQDSLN